MNFKEAMNIKVGDILYHHLGDKLVISGWEQKFNDPCITDDLYFRCVDSYMNVRKYRYNELCGFELCDEDKMFIDWCKNLGITIEDYTPYLKQAFLYGFSCGYSHKMHYNSQEELQK